MDIHAIDLAHSSPLPPFFQICTFIFAILVVLSTVQVLVQSINVIMETVPKHIDLEDIKQRLGAIGGVESVHDFHVWSITTDKCMATAHLVVTVDTMDEASLIIEQASEVIYDAGIHHVTFQTEKHLTGNGSRLCLNNRCDQEMC